MKNYRPLTNTPLRSISATISYCRHTNTKLAISTSFLSSRTAHKAGAIASEHPLFSLPLPTIHDIYQESSTTTERYISMVAYLVGVGVVTTRETGLHLETHELDKVLPVFRHFLYITLPLIHDAKALERATSRWPVLVISNENRTSGGVLKDHLQHCIDILEASDICLTKLVSLRHASAEEALSQELADLWDNADEERRVRRMVAQGAVASKKYTPKIGQWALKKVRSNDFESAISEEQLDSLRYHLNAPAEKLLESNLRQCIAILKDYLGYEDYERTKSLLVIRHLECKLEDIVSAKADYGFVIAEVEESRNEKGLVSYDLRTASKALEGAKAKVVNRRPVGSSALARMMNKFGK